MIGYWISFGLLFPFFLIAVPYVKIKAFKNAKIEITPEIDKQANVRVVLYILFYWLCNLFYMACFIDNLVCKYIFGGLIMLIIFMNLAKAVSYPKNRNGFERWSMLQDFCIGIGLTIYLIYIIPNVDIREIVIPIIAAIYGGMLTLVGVSLTIRKSDIDRKEDEIKKAKPLVFIVDRTREESEKFLRFKFENSASNQNVFTGDAKYKINSFLIKNADYSFACLKGICINNDIIAMNIAQVFDKGQTYACLCDVIFSYNKEINNMYLLLVDMLDNYYTLEVNFQFDPDKRKKTKEINIVSGIELKRVKVDFNNLSFTEV